MSFDYTRSRALAERLIDRYGKPATLVRANVSGPAHDRTQGDPTLHSIRVLDLNIRHLDRAGTLVLDTTRTLYVSTAGGVEPTKRDAVRIGSIPVGGFTSGFSAGFYVLQATATGNEYQIEEVRPLQPGPLTILWEVDLR